MKIGFIGLGIMGESMSENIVKKHDDTVYVYDFVQEKVERLVAMGAVACKDAVALAKLSQVIITMVPKSVHSKAVYQEILHVLDDTKVCIDMSTIDPEVSVCIADMVNLQGAGFLDAPVVKSKQAAIAGKLGIYVGGDVEVYNQMKPLLLYMGENIKYMGGHGKGLVMKICHNALVSQIQNGVNETCVLASEHGISMDDYAEAISYGGGQNFYLDSKKASIRDEDYTTAFSVENMAKDIGICMDMAKACGFDMPSEKVVYHVYERSLQLGFGKEDFCATVKAVRK